MGAHDVAVREKGELRLVEPDAVGAVEDVRRAPALAVVVCGKRSLVLASSSGPAVSTVGGMFVEFVRTRGDDHVVGTEGVVLGVPTAHRQQLACRRDLDADARTHRQARHTELVVDRDRRAPWRRR